MASRLFAEKGGEFVKDGVSSSAQNRGRTSVTSFLHILNFTGSVNCGYFTGDIAKNTLNEPPRNTMGVRVDCRAT